MLPARSEAKSTTIVAQSLKGAVREYVFQKKKECDASRVILTHHNGNHPSVSGPSLQIPGHIICCLRSLEVTLENSDYVSKAEI